LDQLDFNLEPPPTVPTILLANTTWWPCASRLALALTKVGCAVAATYPPDGHPLAQTSVIQLRHAYSALHPVNSLSEAIRNARPYLVVPCDDRVVEHLHELYVRESKVSESQVCRLIERSLGAPASYPIVSARYPLLKIASELGVPIPDTELVSPGQSLDPWAARHLLPWVLKADGSWGGHGTRVVRNRKRAERYVAQMSRPLSPSRAIKRLLVDRDPFWILSWRSRSPQQVIVQAHVDGTPANCAVLCWQGKLLAGIAVEVVCAQGETGSATVIRVVDSPAMISAAERLAAHLGLSGFVGFDFVIEASTGVPYLIEMNPRVTPLCHLQLGPGRDLVSALASQLSGRPLTPAPLLIHNNQIAYFPQAWHRDPGEQLLAATFPDVPWEEPVLVRELIRLPWPDRSLLARLSASLRRLILQKSRTTGVVFQTARTTTEVASGDNDLPRDPTKPPALVPLRQSGSKTPLFIIHGADGQLGRFHRLVRHLEPERPVYGVLPQSLLGEPVVLTSMEQLAAFYLTQIQRVCPEGPYYLLGYSFGGYMALEMARQLSSRGQAVFPVGMIDVLPMTAGLRPDKVIEVAHENGRRVERKTSRVAFHVRRVFRAGGVRYALDRLRGRALRIAYTLFDAIHRPIPAFLQRAYDLNWFAAARHMPEPFPGSISLFQTAASHTAAQAAYGQFAKLAGGGVEFYELSGDHKEILEEPHVQSLAAQVENWLAKR